MKQVSKNQNSAHAVAGGAGGGAVPGAGAALAAGAAGFAAGVGAAVAGLEGRAGGSGDAHRSTPAVRRQRAAGCVHAAVWPTRTVRVQGRGSFRTKEFLFDGLCVRRECMQKLLCRDWAARAAASSATGSRGRGRRHGPARQVRATETASVERRVSVSC